MKMQEIASLEADEEMIVAEVVTEPEEVSIYDPETGEIIYPTEYDGTTSIDLNDPHMSVVGDLK